MAGTAESSNVRRSHPPPSGKMVKILLDRSIRGNALPEGDQYLNVGPNGYNFRVPFGKVCEVPEEVVQIIKDSQSRTKVVDVDKAMQQPRPMGTIRAQPDEAVSRHEYIQDYLIHEL